MTKPPAAPKLPVAAGTKTKKSNPFGAARPREDNLKRAGVDAKELDQKIEERVDHVPASMTADEKKQYSALADALTELKIEVEQSAPGTEARAAAEAQLAAKQKEKRQFVRSLRKTKVVQPYRPSGPQQSTTDTSKLYVGDLDPDMTDDLLFEGFKEYGYVVAAEVCVDRHTGFTRGYGFVTMAGPQDATAALDTIRQNGGMVNFQSGPVRVNFANIRGHRARHGNRPRIQQRRGFENFGDNSRHSHRRYGGHGNDSGYDGRRRGYGGRGRGGRGGYRAYGRGDTAHYQRGGQSANAAPQNWQQRKMQGFSSRDRYDDLGDHAMLDRLLEGDID